MNISKIIPILGFSFVKIFPMFLFLFCIIHYFDFAGKLLNYLGLKYVVYDDYIKNDHFVKCGKHILINIKDEIDNEINK